MCNVDMQVVSSPVPILYHLELIAVVQDAKPNYHPLIHQWSFAFSSGSFAARTAS